MADAAESLYAAIAEGDTGRARLWVRQRPDLLDTQSPAGPSPILTALYYGHEALAREWAALPRLTSLPEACALGETARALDIVRVDPAQLNAPAPDGFTPIGLAAYFGHEDLVKGLSAAGADINKPSANRFEVNALHAAIARGHGGIVAWLLQNGAAVNGRQQDGFTPLHVAAGEGNLPLVRLLLTHGADASLAADDGRNPADLAGEAGHAEIAALLTERAAS